jgi:DNA-binding cell septation regulator SpoVG
LSVAFDKKVIIHYVGREKGRYSLHLCIDPHRKNADSLIRDIVALVNKLPKPARKIWDNAILREFNIGIEAGIRPHAFELRIQTRTLEVVAQVNGRIGITIYGAQVQSGSVLSNEK